MYIVSGPRPLSNGRNHMLGMEEEESYPPGYVRFMQRFGEGTYRGWMNVQLPDREVLQPFAEYGLWEHDDDSPITEPQIAECIAIGTTVDGDFLAVHPQTAQLLWLPRPAEFIQAILLQSRERNDEALYAAVLDEIYRLVYGNSQDGAVYYEPWTGSRSHLFCVCRQGRISLRFPSWPVCVKRPFRRICPWKTNIHAAYSTGNWADMYDSIMLISKR